MFCTRCGAKVEEGAKFCTNCGAPIEHEDDTKPMGRVQPGQKQPASPVIPVQPVEPPRPIEPAAAQPVGSTLPKTSDTARTVMLVVLVAAIVFIGMAVGYGLYASNNTETGGSASNTQGSVASTSTATESDDPEVRSELADYSWSELSQIASLMESQSSTTDALSIAQKYNLVQSSHRLAGDSKSLQLSDGTTVNMQLVGVCHDDLSSSSGKAALSFISTNEVGSHRMAQGTTTDGGWEASELRTFLGQDVYSMLPNDVKAGVVSVQKQSNNVGQTLSVSSVSSTSDYVWAPSIKELAGNVDWSYGTDPSNSSNYNAVFNAEGTQYEYFAQQGIVNNDGNVALSLGDTWWTRSTGPSTGRGRYIEANGDPSGYGNSNDTRGVVMGFCL